MCGRHWLLEGFRAIANWGSANHRHRNPTSQQQASNFLWWACFFPGGLSQVTHAYDLAHGRDEAMSASYSERLSAFCEHVFSDELELSAVVSWPAGCSARRRKNSRLNYTDCPSALVNVNDHTDSRGFPTDKLHRLLRIWLRPWKGGKLKVDSTFVGCLPPTATVDPVSW